MKRIVSLKMDPVYLSKDICLKKAEEIHADQSLDMEVREMAREIYCHARFYYWFHRLEGIPIVKRALDRADPIDMADGGDTLLRRIIFRLTWFV